MQCILGKEGCAVRQSFAEIAGGFVVQETCGECGGGCGTVVGREQGLAMIAAQEVRQQGELAKPKAKKKGE